MQNKYSLKIEDISKRPELFVLALKSILGLSSSYIESIIINKLTTEFGFDYALFKDMPFREALEEIREKVRKQGY